MKRHHGVVTASVILFLLIFSNAHGDIVVTHDGMILNGKILGEKKEHVTFANYHGIFTIDRKQIKEIHKTTSYKEDARLFRLMGRKVAENEIKKNYQFGIEKLKKLAAVRDVPSNPVILKGIYISQSAAINMGRLYSEIPLRAATAAAGEIMADTDFMKKLSITHIWCEFAWFLSKKDLKSVSGVHLSAGPGWEFPLRVASFRFLLSASALMGMGYYFIRNDEERESAVKWRAGLTAGPVFKYKKITIITLLRFDYVYDRRAPLYGPGFSIGAGYKFYSGKPD